MQIQILIDNVTCGACAINVDRVINSVDANAKVAIDIALRRATVVTTTIDKAVSSAVGTGGYDAHIN